MTTVPNERWRNFRDTFAEEIDIAIDAQAELRKRQLRRQFGVSRVVECEVACPCSARLYPHIHSEHEKRIMRLRFKNHQPEVRV